MMTRPRLLHAGLRHAALSVLLVAAALSPAGAMEATGTVLLTVTEEGAEPDAPAAATFDMEMLKAMPQSVIVTSTIWTDGVQEFRGVSLKDFLDAVDAGGDAVRLSAINDYSVEVPVSDAVEGGPIIAYEMNGAPMAVRDKGPLWLVYPYDSDESYRSEVIYARSIWQLDRIAVMDR